MTDRDTSAQILPLEKLVLVIVVVVVDDRPVATETDHSWTGGFAVTTLSI